MPKEIKKHDAKDSADVVKDATQENEEDNNIKPLEEAVKFLRENSEKRQFNQTIDLVINLKNMDAKKEIVNTAITLPHSKGKEIRVGIFSDDAKGDNVISSKEIEAMVKNPGDAKRLAKEYDYFIASAPMMVQIGKVLGRYLAPAGKMPKPIPPKADPAPFVASASKSITLKNNKQLRLQCAVGSEKSPDNEIIDNVKAVIAGLEKSLPKGRQSIKNIMLKLTMSRPVKIVVK